MTRRDRKWFINQNVRSLICTHLGAGREIPGCPVLSADDDDNFREEPRDPTAVNYATPSRSPRIMKTLLAIFAVAAVALASTSPADAKGCLKGAAVGGVAGHYAGHHGMLGAAAGCLYGRHRAKERPSQTPARQQPEKL